MNAVTWAVLLLAGGGLTRVPGIKVGHFTLAERPTGCTVVLTEGGAVAGADVRGGAPGTREIDLLSPFATVEKVHAIVLSGGSAFGLDAASGAVRYLELDDLDGWSGSTLDFEARFDWFFLDNLGVGVGYSGTEIEAQFDDADDLGEAEYAYDGFRAGLTVVF